MARAIARVRSCNFSSEAGVITAYAGGSKILVLRLGAGGNTRV